MQKRPFLTNSGKRNGSLEVTFGNGLSNMKNPVVIWTIDLPLKTNRRKKSYKSTTNRSQIEKSLFLITVIVSRKQLMNYVLMHPFQTSSFLVGRLCWASRDNFKTSILYFYGQFPVNEH